MIYFMLSWFVSFILSIFLVRIGRILHIFNDNDLSGPQKLHISPVPRIGGMAIASALWLLLAYTYIKNEYNYLLGNWLIASLPVFLLGVIEDLCKKISPKHRLISAFLSAGLAIYLTHTYVNQINIPIIDKLFSFSLFCYVFTIFAVAGVINAINIIDGFNGLVSVVCSIMFLSMAYVSWKVNDIQVLLIALSCIGAILGFFILNFPRGFIFLGDGGAYLIGFILSQMSIYLVYKHSDISAWYAVLIFIYPIFETIFSIYRRKFLRGKATTMPDGVHLHTLIYKRLMRWMIGSKASKHITKRNSMTSPYLWLLSAMAVIPATLFYNNTLILQFFCLIFILSYVWLYFSIIKFKSPRWLIMKNK